MALPIMFFSHVSAHTHCQITAPTWYCCNCGALAVHVQSRTSTLNCKAPEFVPSYVKAQQQQQQAGRGKGSYGGSDTVPGGE